MSENTAGATEVRAWVKAARAGDAQAFRRLVESHMRAVYSLGYRLLRNADDADDVAQETFVRAYQALDRYDERYTFYTWLRAIATRLALNEIAKRRRRRTDGGEAFEAAAETIPGAERDPFEGIAGGELQAAIETALDEIPPDYRAVLVLRAYEDLSYAEIASTLEIPVGTVMSRLSRARQHVRQILAARGVALPKREEES